MTGGDVELEIKRPHPVFFAEEMDRYTYKLCLLAECPISEGTITSLSLVNELLPAEEFHLVGAHFLWYD